MNYYDARELRDENGQGTGRWHYTCKNDDQVCPVGYCSPWERCPECKGEFLPGKLGGAHCEHCKDTRLVRKKEPCPGHATPEEACEHQRQYELDHAKFHPETEEIRKRATALFRCEVCGHFTCGYADCGVARVYMLCNEHCNREALDGLVSVGYSISSC